MSKDICNFLNRFQPIVFEHFGYIQLPKFESPFPELSSEEYLIKLANDGFDKKLKEGSIPKNEEKIYRERLDYELGVYKKLQFSDYILLIYDMLQFCKRNEILNSPSRGSCSGSLLLYLIEVTKVDPIKHKLLFERFLSDSRTDIKDINGVRYIAAASLPDVDVDSVGIEKPKINKYLAEKFPNKTCKISNITTLQGKALIKECGKVIGLKSEQEMKKVSELIPSLFGKVEDIEKTYGENVEFKEWCDENPQVYQSALKLRGLIKNKSVHASGIFLSHDDLDDTIPTEIASDKSAVTSYDMSWCQYLGIKVDNLGLKNLAAIKECLNLIGKKMEDIDINDPSIYKFLNSTTNYYGIFQSEEGLGKDTLVKIKPQCFNDIQASLALSRPGCFKFLDEYVANRDKKDLSVDKRIDDILRETNFIIIYQEEILKLSIRMAKFTGFEADQVRKAIGKKLVEKMKSFKTKFISQSVENGFPEELVTKIWQTFEDSGNYLFSANHAAGYGYLTAITAYLKANHPLAFFLSLLKMAKYEQDPIGEVTKIQQELAYFNIQLLPPHLLKSDLDFSIENGNIRYGLLSIRGISDKSMEKLTDFRTKYSNNFQVYQGAEEAGLNVGVLAALIQAGTLDDAGFKKSRSLLVLEAQLWRLLTDKEKQLVFRFADQYNYSLLNIIKHLTTAKDEKGKPFIKESRFETIKKKYDPYKQIYLINNNNEKYANWYYEKNLLGFSYSQTLKGLAKSQEQDIQGILEVKLTEPEEQVLYIGVVTEAFSGVSKKKNKYYKVICEDEGGQITAYLSNTERFSAIDNCKEMNGRLPKEGDIVIIEGKKGDDAVFARKITIQDFKAYTKFGELKSDLKEKTVDESVTKT